MASEIRVYFEGDSKLKPGFGVFLKSLVDAARSRGVRWHLVAGGGRDNAYEDFKLALRKHRDAFVVLLVDSEAAVSGDDPWVHLESLQECRLKKPGEATADNVHLMVQTMESWFLADVEALVGFYGASFASSRLPRTSSVEAITKSQAHQALNESTAKTQKKWYHKTKHAPELLARIDPAKVRAASPWCDRLFKIIEEVIEAV